MTVQELKAKGFTIFMLDTPEAVKAYRAIYEKAGVYAFEETTETIGPDILYVLAVKARP